MIANEKAADIKAVLVLICSLFVGLFGWLGVAVLLLVLAMFVDYITGTIAAKAAGEWSSAVARAGLRHKLGTILAVGAAAFADLGVNVALHTGATTVIFGGAAPPWPNCFVMIVVFWYLFTEVGSILENAGKLGAPIPPWLGKGISALKAKVNQTAGAAVPVPEDPWAEFNVTDDDVSGLGHSPAAPPKGKHEKPEEKQTE